MPDAIKAHLRYPQDLFRAQTDQYRAYHMTNPTTFYNKADLWEVSPDPGLGRGRRPPTIEDDARPRRPPTCRRPRRRPVARIDPIYLLIASCPGRSASSS